MRVKTMNKYDALTEQILKSLNIIQRDDTFVLDQLKSYHNLVNSILPNYFSNLQLIGKIARHIDET